MARSAPPSRAAIGFTVKSGWASAVLLLGPTTAPRVADSRTVALSDPENPDAKQPYHADFGTAREAGPELKQLVASIKRYGGESVAKVLKTYRASGHHLQGVGIVVGSLIDPSKIANDHIRIHALEGQLFRGVVDSSAARSRLARSIWRERDLAEMAATALKRSDAELRRALAGLGREVAGGWRAEQKTAALAAWLVLAGLRSV